MKAKRAVCVDPHCRWNKPDELFTYLTGQTAWEHHHEGQTVVLHLEIG
jgi:hypothetical protein